MFAGVTYSVFVTNVVIATELFLIFRSLWVLAAAACVHVASVLLCMKEPRFFDLWLARVSRCPRVRNYQVWECNSYRP
jgi:type IV secretion system protein VirB3